ncbi:hypothetical protein PCANC_09342 [Puccinia coronata f. sp. avenae]|uniref:F-box domain-containing protein n=1 Tax=Puccinia coronata f. sp. avenae TaxID=200324 RepID=A0A2N5VBF3_9BASI|nr:hypothetical protein PCANC_09342 [Puccinia coronata f. sp. avenae]PLW47301.1 hypothetical protein PCASD_02549 [Puccinia coronata f. sp. avenae]
MSETPGLKSSLTRIFERGIIAFKAGDYPRAIRCFDQAIQASSNGSKTLRINLLDFRAAAKEKNNDLTGSLSDSKKVIDLSPESPKGYICAARLFNKMDKFGASTKMFELAITRITASGKKNLPLIEILQAELQQVRTREQNCMAAWKPHFLSKMPVEIFTRVISWLDTKMRLCCMAVYVSWRQIILNAPDLWSTLSLNSYYHHNLMTEARYWLQHLKPDQQLHTLNITVSPTWPSSKIRDILTFLADRLSKKSAPNACLRSFSFHQARTSWGIADLRRSFGDVIAFAYLNRENLTDLAIRVPAAITCPLTIPYFLATFPLLKALKLQGGGMSYLCWGISPDFPQRAIPHSNPEDNTDSGFPNSSNSINRNLHLACLSETQQARNLSNQKLEILHIEQVTFDSSQGEQVMLAFLRSISLLSASTNTILHEQGLALQKIDPLSAIDFTLSPKLENIVLCNVNFVQKQWDQIWWLVRRLPTLKRLRLNDSGNISQFMSHFLDLANIPLNWSPQDFPDQLFQLDSLSVAGLRLEATTEPLLIHALTHLPPLVKLDLSSTRAQEEVLQAIKINRLKHLNLNDCFDVTFSSIQRLATPNLEGLDIGGCELISTREMIQWLVERVGSVAWEQGPRLPLQSSRRLFLD